jgi:hypothetical protein
MEVDEQCGPGWESDPSLEGPCCDPGNQLLGAPIDPACYTGGGGGASSPAPPAQGACTNDSIKIATTLTNLASDVLGITTAKDASATASEIQALAGTLNSDAGLEEQTPLSFFVGGHFNLDVSLSAIALDLGGAGSAADNSFLTLFKGKTFDGVRQGPVQTTDPNHNYWLHSKPSGSNIDFHFDRYNPWAFGGGFGHLGVDLFWGNIGTHCLDPAWRSN